MDDRKGLDMAKIWDVKFISTPPLPHLWGKNKAEANRLSNMSQSEYQAMRLQEISDSGWEIFTVLAVGSTSSSGGDNYSLKVICFKSEDRR